MFSHDRAFLHACSGFGNPFGALVICDELIVSGGDTHTVSRNHISDGGLVRHWGGPGQLQLPHLPDADGLRRLNVTGVKRHGADLLLRSA